MSILGNRASRWTARLGALALGVGVLLPLTVGTSGVQAIPSLPIPTNASGAIQDGAANSIPGACVYVAETGSFTSVIGGSSGYLQQFLPGGCADADGNYSFAMPPIENTLVAAPSFVVTSPSTAYAGVVWKASQGPNVTLPSAGATVSGNVSTNVGGMSTPVMNAYVQAFDMTSNQVLGVAETDVAGNYTMGVIVPQNPMDTLYVGAGFPLGKGIGLDTQAIQQLPPVTNGAAVDAPQLVLPDYSEITGNVTVNGTTALPYQLVAAQCSGTCAGNVYALTDTNGNYSLVVPFGAQVTLAVGGQHVDVQASQPVVTVPTVSLTPTGKNVGALNAAPTTWLSAGDLTLNQNVSWSWSGGSLVSAPDAWQTSTATATWKSALTKYSAPVSVLTQSQTAKIAFGATQCLKVSTIAYDALMGSPLSDLGATSCFTVPLDDRALKASAGWKRLKSTKSFAGTVTTVAKAKSTLTLTGVTGSTLSVLWSRTAKGGSFTVSVNGKVVKTVSTKGATALAKVTTLPKKAMKGAKVVITTTSKSPVSIDGLAVQP